MRMQLFEDAFGARPARVTHTPGRANLLGEWIDFSGGLVLPMALPLNVKIGVSPNHGTHDVIVSEGFDGEARYSLDAQADNHWADLVRGALQAARANGWALGGYNVAITSDVPHGRGLSASAAVCVGTLRAVRSSSTAVPETNAIALMAQKIETDFIGAPCGIMDQMVVAHADRGQVLMLESENLYFRVMDLPDDWHIAVIDTGIKRKHARRRYTERREECLAAAKAMGIKLLCHGDLMATRDLPAPLSSRARHVISEDIRARAAQDALEDGDRNLFGELMIKGHASIRDDFDIVPAEVDAIVSDAVRLGADGARQTGSGFGGCIVALMADGTQEDWWAALSAKHPQASRLV